jgi:hypothetical protein
MPARRPRRVMRWGPRPQEGHRRSRNSRTLVIPMVTRVTILAHFFARRSLYARPPYRRSARPSTGRPQRRENALAPRVPPRAWGFADRLPPETLGDGQRPVAPRRRPSPISSALPGGDSRAYPSQLRRGSRDADRAALEHLILAGQRSGGLLRHLAALPRRRSEGPPARDLAGRPGPAAPTHPRPQAKPCALQRGGHVPWPSRGTAPAPHLIRRYSEGLAFDTRLRRRARDHGRPAARPPAPPAPRPARPRRKLHAILQRPWPKGGGLLHGGHLAAVRARLRPCDGTPSLPTELALNPENGSSSRGRRSRAFSTGAHRRRGAGGFARGRRPSACGPLVARPGRSSSG